MKVVHRAHIDAAKELVELMSIAGWIALLADLIWVVRDNIVNGWPLDLLPVLLLLLSGFIIMTYGVVKYHKRQHKAIIQKMLQEKLWNCKRKYKRD